MQLRPSQIPPEVSRITAVLEEAGFEAWIVGGCVRDLLLGRKPKDWDITTNANPQQIQGLFENTFYTNEFGTVGIVNEGIEDESLRVVEATPYRLEGKYSDARRPDSVEFSQHIEDDLKRRDFTVNALAYSPLKDKLLDPYEGIKDIGAGILRAVGEPGERFAEDALRIMRAVRISAELGFDIEAKTKTAMGECAAQLEKISKERIRDEFMRILQSPKPMKALILSQNLGILRFMAPELEKGIGIDQNQAHSFDVWEHNLRSLQHAADKGWSFEVRLAALFHDVGKPQSRRRSEEKNDWTFHGHEVVGARMTKKVLENLKFPGETIEKVTTLVRWHMFFSDPDKITRGYDSNPTRVPNGPGSQFTIVQPELQAKSEWTRHELTATLRGSYLSYDSISSINRPSADLRVNGRIDVRRDTKVLFEARYLLGADYPGSPNLSAGLAKLPISNTLGATVGLVQSFNRLELSLRGSFDRTTYRESELTDGSTFSNHDRDYNQFGGQVRAGYEITPGVKPFVEFGADRRAHDLAIDRSNEQRDSRATTPKVGTSFEITRILTGEVSVGYVTRTYQDPNLAQLRGIVVDGSLIWVATGLTTATFTARSSADESILAGVSGALRRDVGLQVDHAFRRWLVGTFKVGAGFDEYVGLGRSDRRTSLGAALTYKFSREFWLKGEVRQDWLKSNLPNTDNSATTFLLGVRLQR